MADLIFRQFHFPGEAKHSGFTTQVNSETGALESESYSDTYTNVDTFSHTEIVDSVKSPPAVKPKRRVVWVPRFPVKEPKKPYIKQLRPYPAPLTAKREGQSDRSYRNAVKRHDQIHESITLINISIKRRNDNALAKYERKMAKFAIYREQLAKGVMRTPKTVYTNRRPDNYYLRTRVSSYGTRFFECLRYADIGSVTYDPILGYRGEQTPYSFGKGHFIYVSEGTEVNDPIQSEPRERDEHEAMLDSTDRRAIARLLKKIREEDYHLGNTLVEGHQTFKMLVGTLEKLLDITSVKGFVKRQKRVHEPDVPFVKQAATTGSDTTLEYLFGWKPLVNELYGLSKAAEQIDLDEPILVVHGSAKEIRNVLIDEPGVPAYNANIQVSTRYVLRYKVASPAIALLNHLGLINPLEPIWERLPWSFVVDWFQSIGTYLSQLGAMAGYEFHSGTKTVTTVITRERTTFAEIDPSATDGLTHWFKKEHSVSSEERKERVLLTEPPTPIFPPFKNPISGYHIVESLALLIQRLR